MHVALLAEDYLTELQADWGLAHRHRMELERRGHDVTVITNHRPDVSHRESKIVEVPALTLPDRRGTSLALPGLGHVDSILRRASVAVAYEPHLLGRWAADRAASLGLPSIYVHDPARSLSVPDLVIVNRFGAVMSPLPSDHAALGRAGVTAPVYPVVYGLAPAGDGTLGSNQVYREQGLSLDVPILLYAGPLTSEANLPLLIDALLPIEPPLHCVIAGDGPARHAIEQHLIARQATRHIGLVPASGPSNQALYRAAAVALSAGGDPHPTWLVEAASQGIPIVAVRTPQTESVVINRSTGILTLPTRTALTRAVTQLLHRPALRYRYGQAAQAHAQSFRIERSVDQLLDVCALVRRLHRVEQ